MTPRIRQLLVLATLALTGCVSPTLPPETGAHRTAVVHLKEASAISLPAGQRIVLYLDAAREAAGLLDSPDSGEAARVIYNKAAADLTVLLRNSEAGRMWNRPQRHGSGASAYRLRFAGKSRNGLWDPNRFTSFTPAAEVSSKSIERENRQEGVGGALVGIRKTDPLEPFSTKVGITAPVTAVLHFKDRNVTLALVDPTVRTKDRIAGKTRRLDADFSAPLAYYPQESELLEGIMGAIRVSDHMGITGLYMMQPYEADRIPLIFVHGLISTPRMWRNVINELEADPVLRRRYQCWVFAYPTGNPPFYSALRLREELEQLRQIHPEVRDYVLVGHSMGGLLSRTQVTSMDRSTWDQLGVDTAHEFFDEAGEDSLIRRALIFQANPRIDRTVFICTPHRGSEMAVGSLGDLAVRLISLPADLASSISGSIGDSVSIITGDPKRLPNSIDGLRPGNPALKVMDTLPIEVPHHSIIGDRGKGDTPDSSDGVVGYWSSHLDSATSEKIVPGPHGACELPETLDELRRILHLHLTETQP